MYTYLPEDDRHRCYRPDLLPIIKEWLTTVPEADWAYFVGFRVGLRGQFVAKFMKQPTRGGELKLVTFQIDHNYSEMRTKDNLWTDRAPVKFTSANLTMAADTN